jgi:hypothetical protein
MVENFGAIVIGFNRLLSRLDFFFFKPMNFYLF